METTAPMAERAAQFRDAYARVRAEINKVIVGHQDVVDGVLTCLFVGGHCPLEGVPGLGKTLLVRTLSQVLDLKFNRIQFTPDLMPSDIIGTNIISETPEGKRVFSFQSGPIFAQIVLADEINRATPKTQSALLEAMQEHSVTVGGTILDRTTKGEWPQAQKVMDGSEIARWQQLVREVLVAPPVQDYAIRLVLATHPQGEFALGETNRYIRCGASPRGAQALVLAGKVRALLEGRYNVSFEGIRRVYLPALRHRILLNFEAQAENIAPDSVLAQILDVVKEKAQELAIKTA